MEATQGKAKVNPYAKYHADPAIMKAGVMYEDDDVRIKVTYAGTENSRYEKMLKMVLKPYERRIKDDQLPDPEYFKLLSGVYAATVILSWEVKDETGKFVPGVYTEEGEIIQANEAGIKMGLDLGTRLFQDVIKVATNFNLFRQGQKEEDAKN